MSIDEIISINVFNTEIHLKIQNLTNLRNLMLSKHTKLRQNNTQTQNDTHTWNDTHMQTHIDKNIEKYSHTQTK